MVAFVPAVFQIELDKPINTGIVNLMVIQPNKLLADVSYMQELDLAYYPIQNIHYTSGDTGYARG